jgi:hypothetical protein
VYPSWTVEFLDGRLEEGRRRDAEGHLAACSDCRREVELHQATDRLLDLLPAATFDADRAALLADRVESRARGAVPDHPPVLRRRWMRPLVAAAAVLLLAIPAMWSWQDHADPSGGEELAEEDLELLLNREFSSDFEVIEGLGDLVEMGKILDLEEGQACLLTIFS